MKKTISLIVLSAMLLLALPVASATAADSAFTIEAKNMTASPGESILFVIAVSNNPGVSLINDLRVDLGAGLTLEYPSGTTYGANPATWPFIPGNTMPAYEEGMIPIMGRPTNDNIGPSHIVFQFQDTSEPFNSTEDGVLVTLRLKVGAAASGDLSVTLSGGMYDSIPSQGTRPPTLVSGKVTIPASPVITTDALPDGTANVPYSQALAATGGGITWSIASGDLPPGLSLNSATGEIYGTPTAAGTFNFSAKASNGNLPDAIKPLFITIKTQEVPGTQAVGITTNAKTKFVDKAEYTISATNMDNVNLIVLDFLVDCEMLSRASATVEGLGGFSLFSSLIWTDMGGDQWQLRAILTTFSGVTKSGSMQVGRLCFDPIKAGDAQVSLRNVAVYGVDFVDDDLTSTLRQTILSPASATTRVYSVYDLNSDNEVGFDDLSIALYYYLSAETDANWEKAKIADVNGDGRVDMVDLVAIYSNFTLQL